MQSIYYSDKTPGLWLVADPDTYVGQSYVRVRAIPANSTHRPVRDMYFYTNELRTVQPGTLPEFERAAILRVANE